MKRSRLFAGVLALAMTAVTLGSPMCVSSVKAAEVTDKKDFDFKIMGNYTEKNISEEDVTALAKAFGYDMAATGVHVCSADATGYVNWDNSAIKSWQVYQTEVFQPVLSRDANGNLVVATDGEGNVQKAWSNWSTYCTEKADEIVHKQGGFFDEGYDKTEQEINQEYSDFEVTDSITDAWVQHGFFPKCVLSENHFCLSDSCGKSITTINSHLGITELVDWKPLNATEQMASKKFYTSEKKQISDAYVIRIYYTADDIPLNWTQRTDYLNWMFFGAYFETVKDVYGNVFAKDVEYWPGWTFPECPEMTEDRTFRYTDIWILPEGVDTVLTLEDVPSDDTPNTPDTPSEGYVVDFSNTDSQTVTKEDFSAMLEANKESDVVIKSNNGVTFTFAKGTMTEVDGKESYDFSTSIMDTYLDSMPSYIQKNSFVSQINFNYSGKLPAMASIRFYVGTEYAGKTLYYSLMNEDNTFAVINSYVVDAEGYITVQQNHCSSYVVTTTQPQQKDNNGNDTNTPSMDNGNDNSNTPSMDNGSNNTNTTKPSDNNAASPKTGDTTNPLLMIIIMIFSAGGVVFVKKCKTA